MKLLLKFKTRVNQDGLDVIMNGLQAAIKEYDSDPKNAGNNYQYFVQAPRFLNKKVYMDYQEKAKPKKPEKTAEQLQAKKIRDLMNTYELGLDYWENIDGSPEIYHEAVKELKELGQL